MEQTVDLIEAIAKLFRMTRRKSQSGDPISRQEHRMLGTILREDGIRTTDLADRMDIRPASLTASLKRLETYGYIHRERGTKDTRVIHVCATEKAVADHVQFEAERQAQNEQLLTCLTPEETEDFLAICGKLYAYLESQDPRSSGAEAPENTPTVKHESKDIVP